MPSIAPDARRAGALASMAAAMMAAAAGVAGADAREPVALPAPMAAHLLANMRDHLSAMGAIQAALGDAAYSRAAEIAEHRLGMSSLETHGAQHMAAHLPAAMRAIGTRMHQAASRLANVVEETEVTGDVRPALRALSEVTAQCVACHEAFRLR